MIHFIYVFFDVLSGTRQEHWRLCDGIGYAWGVAVANAKLRKKLKARA
jgi:hypothetical protein